MRNNDYDVRRRALALRALIVLASTLAVAACGNSGGDKQAQGQQTPPTPVHVDTIKPHSVDVYAEYPGRVQGKQTAQVVGQVTGVLKSKSYNEGAIVHKGDVLFTIDQKPYKATVAQRKAALSSAKASLSNTSRIWERTRKLYKANAVSEAERDQALSRYQADKAAVQQAQANLESAQIDLDYTTVQAPITGVTSLRDVDLGSLVTANQTQLATITQLDPVYVMFALPEDDAFARQKALSEMGKKTTDEATREATVLLKNGQKFPYKADVDFTQSTIDPETGTVRLRAIVKNPNNTLMPGRYVRVRLRIQTLDNAITVPDQAISGGQQTQVFVVKNGKADAVAVKLGPHTADGQVISQGLSAGDQVITTGLGTLQGGAPVKVQQGSGQPSDQNQDNKGSDASASASDSGSDSNDASQNS